MGRGSTCRRGEGRGFGLDAQRHVLSHLLMRMMACVLRNIVGLETGDGDWDEVYAPRRIRKGGWKGGRKGGRKGDGAVELEHGEDVMERM